jgi:hypothetical protein
MEYQKG